MENKILNDCLLTLRMPSNMRSKVETLAIDNECSVSSVVRYAISNLQSDEE